MALVTTKEMFKRAFEGKYAIGAFNIGNQEIIQGIAKAASENNSSVIMEVSKSALKYSGAKVLKAIVDAVVAEYDLDLALHLDHGPDFETAKLCIEAGFTSVMFDGSHYDFKTNIEKTKEVVEYAHAHGVVVEAELGKLAGVEDEVSVSKENATYTDPEEAVEFVVKTGVDSLAVAIGTSHGAYKFKGEPKLDFERLSLITEKLTQAGCPNFPIVLHGASSVDANFVETCNKFGGNIKGAKGVPDEILRQATQLAVCKINMDTDIRLALTAGIRQFFAENPDQFDPRGYMGLGRENIANLVDYKIKNVLGSVNSKNK